MNQKKVDPGELKLFVISVCVIKHVWECDKLAEPTWFVMNLRVEHRTLRLVAKLLGW